MLNQKRPNSIDPKQINRKEHNRNQSNDRGVFYFVGGRPRNSPHFCASVAQELRGALEESGAWARQPALAPDRSAFGSLTKSGRTWRRRSNGFFHGSVARRCRLSQGAKLFVFFASQFFSQCANFSCAILAGVPGFEPGLSVLETDVLTVDTIPLLTLPIFNFRLRIDRCRNANSKSAIGNRKCHLVSL